jgi:hypothetical protein
MEAIMATKVKKAKAVKAAAKTVAKAEVYRARRGKEVAPAAMAPAAAAPSGYTIEVVFLGGLTPKQKAAFKLAAKRWTSVIVGDLPDVLVGGETINNLRITAQGTDIDGPGNILGQAGPDTLRPANAGDAAFLPATGTMEFDTADLAGMQADGTLNDVITHEMGHVIGVGTVVWRRKGLLKGAGTTNPTFVGKNAMREFAKLTGAKKPTPVPVENQGGPGTRDSHWRESVFNAEMMTGIVDTKNPMSRMTVASLQDLGYKVDLSKAEPYTLPDHLAVAAAGVMAAHAEHDRGHTLPRLPRTLPDDSLA